MRVYKDKQFLVFDFENGKMVKYDFATKQAIGKNGKVVKNLNSQLSGVSLNQIFECCDDVQYAKFLNFVKVQEESYCRRCITNIGTILDRVPKYKNFEQIFSAGFEDIISQSSRFTYTINDIPKSLIKVCKAHKIIINNNNNITFYKQNPDAHYLLYNLEYQSLNDTDILKIWQSSKEVRVFDNITERYRYERISYFNELINNYGYTAKALALYVDDLKTFEAIENISFLMSELFDYAVMMKQISPKFDKYPRHFLTTHKIACRNYNRLRQEFDDKVFKSKIVQSMNVRLTVMHLFIHNPHKILKTKL